MHLEVAPVDAIVVGDHHAGQLDVLLLHGLERAVERVDDHVEAAERLLLELRELFWKWVRAVSGTPLPDLPGDVSLRASRRVREDLLGVVELDDAPERCSSSSSSTVKNAVLSDTRAACCMLCVTITIE